MIQCRELFEFLWVFDQFLGRLDAQGFGEPGVALSLSALLYAFELDGFPGNGVAGGGAAGGALADVAAGAGLFDGCGAGIVFGACRGGVAIDRAWVFADSLGFGADLVTGLLTLSRRVASLLTSVKAA